MKVAMVVAFSKVSILCLRGTGTAVRGCGWSALDLETGQTLCPSAVEILDYYHCCEHLHKVAALRYEAYPVRQQKWSEAAMARLIWGAPEQQPIGTFPSRLVLEPALEVAFDTNRTVDNSRYLALAMLTGCQLVTADHNLFDALQNGSYATHVCWVANLP